MSGSDVIAAGGTSSSFPATDARPDGTGGSGSSVGEPPTPFRSGLRGARTSGVAKSRESDPAAGPPPGHGRRDDDEPPDPVDPAGCLDAQSSGDVVADQHAADAAEQGQPEGDVVPVAGSDELPQQSDDQTRDENSDDLHVDAFHSESVIDRV